MKRLILLFFILMSFHAFSQDDFESSDSFLDEQGLSVEEGSLESELITPRTDEVANPSEERQEDILYPEGEESAWSLGSDEIASEDFE